MEGEISVGKCFKQKKNTETFLMHVSTPGDYNFYVHFSQCFTSPRSLLLHTNTFLNIKIYLRIYVVRCRGEHF